MKQFQDSDFTIPKMQITTCRVFRNGWMENISQCNRGDDLDKNIVQLVPLLWKP